MSTSHHNPQHDSQHDRKIHGSCLCKWIKFTIKIPPTVDMNTHPTHFTSSGKLRATNCHCSTCRLSVGALFGTWAHVPAEVMHITDLAMNMGSFRSSKHATRKFCSVCGTSLFSHDDGWEVVPEDKEVSMANMYNREFVGRKGRTIDVSVAAMETQGIKRWIDVSEHIFLDEVVDEEAVFDTLKLPKYALKICMADG